MRLLRLRFLGTFEVLAGETAVTHFRTDKMRALLAYLAMNGDQPTSRDNLAQLFWPDHPDVEARRNLRQTLHRLRQEIAAHSQELEESLFEVNRQTVQLNLAVASLDAAQFQEGLAYVGRHHHGQLAACDDCLNRLSEAVGLYHGELLTGLSLKDAPPFEEWLLIQREYLQRQYLETLQQLADAYDMRDEYQWSQEYAQQLLAIAPWHEAAHRHLMQLYWRQGQTAKAVAQYQRCVQLLEEELDVPPSAETESLYQQIIAGEYKAPAPPKSGLHHFPTQFGRFVGRQSEIEQIVKQLLAADGRLLTLHGLGGIGKTRLAVEAAAALAESGAYDDLFFIPLAGVDTAEAMINAIARSLALTLDKRPSPRQQLVAFLRDKRYLLLLDNFEQLLENAGFLSEIVSATPNVRLLVTSREWLNLIAEKRLSLEGLAAPPPGEIDNPADYPALTLFERAVRRVKADFELDEESLPVAARICRLVEGMPLALEMTAAWARLLELETIAAKIEENLDFLTAAARDVPERHQSMRAVFNHSWETLTDNQQRALAQMAVFRGDFSLDAAKRVAAVTLPDLAVLIDKSLVTAFGNSRYALHNLLRQFTAEKLADRAAATAAAHSRYYLGLVAGLTKSFAGPAPHHARDILLQEIGNIYPAWETAVQQNNFDLLRDTINSFYDYFELTGLFLEANMIFQQAIDRLKTVLAGKENEEWAITLGLIQTAFARFAFETGLSQEAQTAAQEALDTAERYRHIGLKAHALYILSVMMWWNGDPDGAEARLIEANALFTRAEELPFIVRTKVSLCFYLGQRARFDEALAYGNTALELSRSEGFLISELASLDRLGTVYESMLDLDKALEYQEEIGRIIEPMKLERRLGMHLLRMGIIYYLLCDFPRALAYNEEHSALHKRYGNQVAMTSSQSNIAMIYEKQGKYKLSLATSLQVKKICLETNNKWGLLYALTNMGYVLNCLDEYEQAMEALEEALTLAQSFKNKKMEALILNYIGLVYLRRQDLETAEKFQRQALAMDEEINNQYGVALHLCNLSHILTIRGKAAEAMPGFVQAAEIQQEKKDRYHLSQTLIWQAGAHQQLQAYETAEALAREGTEIAEEIGRPDMILEGNTLLAEIMKLTGRKLEAEEFLKAATATTLE